MYQRLNVQKRILEFLDWDKEKNYPGIRVKPGYQVNPYLEHYENYISNNAILQDAIRESDIKAEGTAENSINFNLSAEAARNLQELKGLLDEKTGRHFYPAQVLDILLICVRSCAENPSISEKAIHDTDLCIALNELIGDLLSRKELSTSKAKAKAQIIEVLLQNNLL